jgi:hypothetical protein
LKSCLAKGLLEQGKKPHSSRISQRQLILPQEGKRLSPVTEPFKEFVLKEAGVFWPSPKIVNKRTDSPESID